MIEEHLNETIGFQGHLEGGDQVCYSCYRSHLVVTKSVSRDAVLITTLKQSTSASVGISTVKELFNVALNRIAVNVGEELLQNEILHLPVVHDQFQDYASNLRPFRTCR